MLTFNRCLLAGAYASVLTLSSMTLAEDEVHWSYSGDTGPGRWSELSDKFVACNSGKNQSPLNILTSEVVPAQMSPIKLAYKGKTSSILNNGHTLQVNVAGDNTATIDGDVYQLLQFHFHSPSEHEIDGERFPLEIHFVHKNAEGEFAVLGGVYREGEESTYVHDISDKASREVGESVPFVVAFDEVEAMINTVANYYHYSGSLTTPPCTEGIRWYVYPLIATISRDQIADYVKLIGFDARGVQPLNARRVLYVE